MKKIGNAVSVVVKLDGAFRQQQINVQDMDQGLRGIDRLIVGNLVCQATDGNAIDAPF